MLVKFQENELHWFVDYIVERIDIFDMSVSDEVVNNYHSVWLKASGLAKKYTGDYLNISYISYT